MGRHLSPICGMRAIPAMGLGFSHSSAMPRSTLAENLRNLMDARPDLDTIKKVVKRGGGSNGTIGRMLQGDTSARIDAVADVAKVFGLEPWQLLVPGLDPAHPPTLEMDPARAAKLQADLVSLAARLGPKPS